MRSCRYRTRSGPQRSPRDRGLLQVSRACRPALVFATRQVAGGELDADQAMAIFARVDVSDLPEVERPVADCPDPAGRIVVVFPSGARLRIHGPVDPTALRIVLAELTR